MTTPPAPSPSTVEREPFSQVVRRSTWHAHGNAADSAFMAALSAGELPRAAYVTMLGQLALVYGALEAAAHSWCDDPIAGPFLFVELERGDAFAADVAYLSAGRQTLPARPLPATRRYVDRLEAVCGSWAAGFVAHHYTRFLGDLSGGQAIRAALARAYGLRDGRGVRSLTFERVHDRGAFREEYRRRIDAMTLDASEQARFVDEVLLAYELNASLTADICAVHPLPAGR